MTPEQRSDLQAIADGVYWKSGPQFNPLVALAQAVLELDAKAAHLLYCLDGGPDPIGPRLEPMFGEATATSAALSINALATASATATATINHGSSSKQPHTGKEIEMAGELKSLDDILRDWGNGSMDAAGTIEDLVHLLEFLHAELERREKE